MFYALFEQCGPLRSLGSFLNLCFDVSAMVYVSYLEKHKFSILIKSICLVVIFWSETLTGWNHVVNLDEG
jgi:hypothetical protein